MTVAEIEDQYGDRIYVFPVYGVSLTEATKFELRIARVTLVTEKKLRRVRRRFGFPKRISEHYTRMGTWLTEMTKSTGVVAVYKSKGKGKKLTDQAKAVVRDELNYLSLSQLGFSRRRINGAPRIDSTHNAGAIEHWMLNRDSGANIVESKSSGRLNNLDIDKNWKRYHKRTSFPVLLGILRKEVQISKDWRTDLINACLLGGRSQSEPDGATAFLWNMIAIETVLTGSNDKYSVELPKRVFAFIGWATDWQLDAFEERLNEVYKKRCSLVHAGRLDVVNIDDVLFTDTVLLNVLENVLLHLSVFTNKMKLIDFSDRVQAEKTLGMPPKVRPKTMRFVKPKYTDRDRDEI